MAACVAGAVLLAPATSFAQSGIETPPLRRSGTLGGGFLGGSDASWANLYISSEIRELREGPFEGRLAANRSLIELATRLARDLDPSPDAGYIEPDRSEEFEELFGECRSPERLCRIPERGPVHPGDIVVRPLDVLHPLAIETLNLLTRWVTTSCPGEAGAQCFDPDQILALGRCSLNDPFSCQHLEKLAAWTGLHRDARFLDDLDIDRARVRERSRGTRVRLRGFYEADPMLPEDGAVTVLLGEFAASVPLSEFRDKGTHRKWKGRRQGLRAIKLYEDGRFLIVARRIEAEVLDGSVLPFLLQVGPSLGGRFIPFE